MAKFLKSNGTEETFDAKKVFRSITKAMKAGSGVFYPKLAQIITEECEEKFGKKEAVSFKEIDKFVLKKLNDYGQTLTAGAYERYKTAKHFQNQEGIIDRDIIGIVRGTNDAAIQENANKDAELCSTQRDLIAGAESRSYCERKIIPTHLLHAHKEGLIHIHDTDYMIHPIFNCQLINLKDMLDNGTVINGKLIESPKSFQTACTIATQISLSVANGQYGGQTFSVAHIAPYVRKSYEKYVKDITESFKELGIEATQEQIEAEALRRTRKEVKDGVQTIQYQENTFSSSNGQTPFVSICLYVDEEPEYKKETAMIIEEVLKQRLLGMKNENGVYVTPSFPKLLYFLDEDNVPKDSEYRYLTDLAVKCAAKRMNPDFISAKMMRENCEGQVFACMGCVNKDEVITYKIQDKLFVESFYRAWNRLSELFEVKEQDAKDCYYIDLTDVTIFDSTKDEFVVCQRIIKNDDKHDWVRIKTSNGRLLTCTKDHPLAVVGKGRTLVQDIQVGDVIEGTWKVYSGDKKLMDSEESWVKGIVVCDGSYSPTQISCSFAITGEDDIIERLCKFYESKGLIPKVRELHRGVKGNYKEVFLDTEKNDVEKRKAFVTEFVKGYEGKQKIYRKIPNEIFESDEETRLHFLGGIIDADGYVHDNGKTNFTLVEIGSTNKELAIGELMLVNSLGFYGKMIENHYTSKRPDAIRYQVSFVPSEEFLQYITCEKKRSKFVKHRSNVKDRRFIVTDIKEIVTENEYSYDVTTESDRFDVSCIASHNCRSFLSPWKDENGNYKFYGRLTTVSSRH